MDEELEERIERKKRQIGQVLELSEKLGMKSEEREKRLDALLEDLKKLMDKRN